MRSTSVLSPSLALALLAALEGCPRPEPHDHGAAPRAAPQPVQALEVPAAADPAAQREVRVLLENESVKLVAIRLRGGALLPEHTAPTPVVLSAAEGRGEVLAGARRIPLGPGRLVALGAREPHAVQAAEGADLVVLVYHARGAAR